MISLTPLRRKRVSMGTAETLGYPEAIKVNLSFVTPLWVCSAHLFNEISALFNLTVLLRLNEAIICHSL